ncbi:MAG TPA: carbohydrate kinase family protein [Anaerolineaceae bacterium]|nr:carbohydrate kinase family protein [Anaerolineaceae bacterium]
MRNEYIIDTNGKAVNSLLGGSLLYSAAAVNRWGGQTGLLGMIGQDFPREKIDLVEQNGLDVRGIKVLPENLDLTAFYAYPNGNTCLRENPVAVYAANNLPVPKELLDYAYDDDEPMRAKFLLDARIFVEDIPLDYLDSSAAHICPLDLTCQIQLSTLLQKGAVRTLTVQPHHSSMIPACFDDIAIVTKDTAAFITHEIELRQLFQNRTNDLWEMLTGICGYGCQTAIVRNTTGGFSLHERNTNRRFRVPDYPSHRVDPTGEMDVFCGAFLAAYHENYDPLYSVTLASAAASIKVESSGPFSINASLPGLDQARLAALRDMVTRY